MEFNTYFSLKQFFKIKCYYTLLLCFCLLANAQNSFATYDMENLDRGLVAVALDNTVFVGWRWLGNEPDDIAFNIYRNNIKLNAQPLTNRTNYIDSQSPNINSDSYSVRAVVNGQEQVGSKTVSVWANPYSTISLNRPSGGTSLDNVSYDYSPNDTSIADLDGDGEYEIVVKWNPSNAKDNSQSGYTGKVYLDAYELDGTQLWRIDLGWNIRAGAHYTQFMVYDFDSDGKAEVACRTADGSVDGLGNVIGSASADYRTSAGYILSGPEFLTVFEGTTGRALATTDYVPARGAVSDWGDNYGNRVDRFLAGVAYLDGERPSLIMSRGYYTRAVVAAWDWRDGQLSQRWVFDSNDSGNSAYRGEGAHSLTVGDVDNDGRHEIIYGAATIDDNGTGLYATGLGHGDALHLSDMDPNRAGLEVFMVHECPSCYGEHGIEMHDGATGDIIWSASGEGTDVGRGVAMDIDPRYSGYEAWASRGGLYSAQGQLISSTKPGQMNFAVYWDGDLLRELLDGTIINKWNYQTQSADRLLTAYNYGAAQNNGTKANPALSADILGDWREEVIWRHENNSSLLLFTTRAESDYRLRTLMHDPQYRVAIAWQNAGYNQPPHPSFFLGEGMSMPPAPDIRIVNGGDTPVTSLELSAQVNSDQANLNWTIENISLSALEIYRDTDADPSGRTRIAIVNTATRSYTDSGLSVGTTYYYWIKATDSNGVVFNSNAAAVTTDDDSPVGQASCEYLLNNEWGSGFTANIRITNNSTSLINGWSVSWQYTDGTQIIGSWNANVTGNNPYTATQLSWNANLPVGQSLEFGFQGEKGSGVAQIPVISGSVCH